MSHVFLPILATLGVLVAPATAGTETTDAPFDLASLRGNVILVDFWASWCAPCRDSFPWMAGLERRYGRQGLKVVAINLDENRPAAEAFLRKFPNDFEIVFDPEGRIAEAYQVPALPSSILFDRDGRLAVMHAGFRRKDRKSLERRIVALLEGEKAKGNVQWDRRVDAGGVRPWERGVLANDDMSLECERIDLDFDDHVYFSKEASSGGRGFGSGGCGCN